MGTDALLAMERFKNGTIYRKYIDAGVNWVDSPWLMEEVSSIGVKPEYVTSNMHVLEPPLMLMLLCM